MPTKLVMRVNQDLLYPPFRDRTFAMLAYLQSQGHDFFATRGTATYTEQDAIYAQGRTAPGKIVTAARGGFSDHNFGIGEDFTHDSDNNPDNGLQPDWNAPNYVALVEACPRFGLQSGKGYNDLPHVNWPGFATGSDLAKLRSIFAATPGDLIARLSAAWAYLDTLPVPPIPSPS